MEIGVGAVLVPHHKLLTDALIEESVRAGSHILRGDEAVRIQGFNGTASADQPVEYDRENSPPMERSPGLGPQPTRCSAHQGLRKTSRTVGGS
jgi:hypothetical protein